MNMEEIIKKLKYPICLIMGHKITTPSIIKFSDTRNSLCKCDRCGLYQADGIVGSITVSEMWAMRRKAEFETMFGELEALHETDNNKGRS